jgi:hypothetical protein
MLKKFILAFLVSGFSLSNIFAMEISSPAFKDKDSIPVKYTCDGDNISPALAITGVPPAAKSLVLIVDDPDAPMGTWVHWLVFDMPVIANIREASVPGKQAINSAGRKEYHGPCPPSGTHRYFFKLFALDNKLGLMDGCSKEELDKAMGPHVIAKAEIMGLYKRNK